MNDLISRQAVIDIVTPHDDNRAMRDALEELPPAQPQIIYCKDCRKHNKRIGFDENYHTVWKEDACPLASWRGKAQGHEFDYQFCAYGERREVTT